MGLSHSTGERSLLFGFMAQGPRTSAPATMPPNGTTAAHDSVPTAVNRKKQKRREKEAAKRAAQDPPAPASAPAPARNGATPALASSGQQYAEPELEEPPYEEGEYYSDEEYEHTYGANGDYQQGYGHAPVRGGSGKKPRKKKKAPSGPPPLSYSQHIASRHSPAPGHATSPGVPPARSGPKKDRIWNTSSIEERERIRDFWLSLGEDERKSLVKIEKEAVLRKMKEQQKHSCSCTVCGRKRIAIEEELEVLYDAYYEELEQYAHHQQDVGSFIPEANYGGILTVADDLLKNDGKKFIEMMEQLAERRMQREEEAQFHQRMFQIFAARMFEQRVLQAYREKVAAERQQRLLEELAEEDNRKDAKEAKKAKEAQKRKEKKDKQRQLKAEEKARKDAELAAKEAEAKAAEEKRLEEQRKKREEQRKKKEAERKAQEEERQRKEAERLKRQQEERERQQEAERKAREQKALEKKAKEEAKRKEREEREAKEKEAREKKAQEDKDRKEREFKIKAEKDQAAPAAAKKISHPVAVALPPQLLKQNSSTGMPSPHVTPAVPKAPTPNRQRQTSQQNSHGSSPKTPHATLGTSKSTSPTSQAHNQTMPKSILTKPNMPHMPTLHGQPTSPMPHLGPPPGMQGPPGLSMGNMPPGLNGFPNQGSMMPGMMGPRSNIPPFFPPVAPQGFRGFPPPGMHTPGTLPLNRGFPMDGPPGFPAPPGFSTPMPSPFPLGMPTHSRQGSGSFERVSSVESPLGASQSQPIQRPTPIQRPSSIKPTDERVDELANHLGSKALLDDDEDDIPELPERRQSLQQHGSARAASFGFADIPGSQYGSFGGPGGGSIWGTPPLQGFSSGGNWGNSPTSNMFGSPPFPMGNPRMHERSVTEQRIVWLRRTICAVCKSLAPSSDPEGYVDASEVHRLVDSSRNAMEPVVTIDEIKEACDILDVAQTNGGGILEYKEHNGRLTHIKFNDAAPAPPSLGEIGSPVPSQSILAGGFGRFPGLGPPTPRSELTSGLLLTQLYFCLAIYFSSTLPLLYTSNTLTGTMSDPIAAAAQKHPAPKGLVYTYGTAGDTTNNHSDVLDSVLARVGLIAALRSKACKGKWIGVMITASHNPPEDNGVKLVEPMEDWEVISTEMANKTTPEDVSKFYNDMANQNKIDLETPARVVVARDTRASGSRLLGCLLDGLKAAGAEVKDYGFLTTPQLHYMVRCLNTEGTKDAYGTPTEKGYYEKFGAAFKTALRGKKPSGTLTVDCANGVGGPKLNELIKYLPSKDEGGLEISVINDNVIKPESLNVDCGADYVKTNQRAPPSSKAGPGDRCCSLDGDADRVVYYFKDEKNVFRLLDGDRIATLVASFLGDTVRQSGLADQLKIGVVQTAYANGAATKYVEDNLKLKVDCTPTGVKYLHHAAEKLDIGVYFEANGHGTVIFSHDTLDTIEKHEPRNPGEKEALDVLGACINLINQSVGDALSDFLLVEVVLAHKHWGPQEWLSTYSDLPNRLLKVTVNDRKIFKTTDAERKLTSPEGLQAQIDKEVQKVRQGRSFARASGTEDAVRVYAEAETRAEADDLARKVHDLVKAAGGA
ncbi:N-acetylglucosamine-phosphate mutase [Pyrenophora seminiperda CCB06]|uniref:Stress response protein NST1 n=1 Tax=Pyrenophora seminiperda CCB06 TaxID=1302712 RepID=A0A3M7MAX5_9PLEO|nr:N-acetylglucosamine-phosphate mutase [Pyrenophora seminiperda CCB06]